VRVSERRTAIDWAHQARVLVDDPRYAGAERITLVCDNLNTHKLASLYEAFEPAEALRIANRIDLVHTPKHGSWLNVAECELSVMTRQCLSDRLVDRAATGRPSAAGSGRGHTNATPVKSASTGTSPPMMHASSSSDYTRRS